mmetsp:Transcript_7596/g.11379  ORF Transcript_7596/g.11379 Transcript_7596/m.11379 type:complete len:265 (+) Transcript_7596:1188-1982(+)
MAPTSQGLSLDRSTKASLTPSSSLARNGTATLPPTPAWRLLQRLPSSTWAAQSCRTFTPRTTSKTCSCLPMKLVRASTRTAGEQTGTCTAETAVPPTSSCTKTRTLSSSSQTATLCRSSPPAPLAHRPPLRTVFLSAPRVTPTAVSTSPSTVMALQRSPGGGTRAAPTTALTRWPSSAPVAQPMTTASSLTSSPRAFGSTPLRAILKLTRALLLLFSEPVWQPQLLPVTLLSFASGSLTATSRLGPRTRRTHSPRWELFSRQCS